MFNHRTIAALTATAALAGGAAGASAATLTPGSLSNATLGSALQNEQAKAAGLNAAIAAASAPAPADVPAAGSPSNAAIGSIVQNPVVGSLIQNKEVDVGGLGNAPIGPVIQNQQTKTVVPHVVINGGPSNTTLGSSLQNAQAKAAALAAYNAGMNCRAWHVNGQTWFGDQGRYMLMFTLRMASPTSSLLSANSYAAFAPDLAGYSANSGHTQLFRITDRVPDNGAGSRYISGGVNSNTGSIHMDIVWKNGDSGQYNGTAYDVQRSPSGGLTAGLHGTTVDTVGSGASASWEADGMSVQGDYTRPLYCKPGDVVR